MVTNRFEGFVGENYCRFNKLEEILENTRDYCQEWFPWAIHIGSKGSSEMYVLDNRGEQFAYGILPNIGGGGVDGAIHRAGGVAILEDCRKIISRQGGCKVGHAVITTAGNLPSKYVISYRRAGLEWGFEKSTPRTSGLLYQFVKIGCR